MGKRRPKRKGCLALKEPEAPEYGDILRSALTMDKPLASLDDLRFLIQRTRKKLDRQNTVLDGFRTEVRQLKSSSSGPSEWHLGNTIKEPSLIFNFNFTQSIFGK